MRGREVRLVVAAGLLFLLLTVNNRRAFGSRSATFFLAPLPQARVDGGKEEDYRGIVSGSYAGTLCPDPWHSVASAVAAPFPVPQFFVFNNQVSENWTKKLQAEPGYSKHEIDILGVTSCVGIALKCVDKNRNKRSSIKDIVQELEELEVKLKEMSLASDVPKDLWRSCDTKVLSVDPTLELRFLFEPRKEASCCLQLTNKTNGAIAFSVKIDENKYSVRPSQGTMPPCSRRYVVVMLRPQEAAPPNMRCDDILLVHTTGVTQDLAAKDGEIDYHELFEKATADKVVDELKLPIAYVALDQ